MGEKANMEWTIHTSCVLWVLLTDRPIRRIVRMGQCARGILFNDGDWWYVHAMVVSNIEAYGNPLAKNRERSCLTTQLLFGVMEIFNMM